MKHRVRWLDVVKCFGIFAIYWGHYEVAGSHAVEFVFAYHVPLFFFLSGCSEFLSKDEGLLKGMKKVITGLLLPWLFFCVVSVVIDVLATDCELLSLWPSVWRILQGTPRNAFFAWGLWFLTCMAVVKLLFLILRRIKSKTLLLVLCLAIHIASLSFVNLKNPILPFNADCAMYYLLYFGIGYVSFSWIDQLLQTRNRWGKAVLGISFCVAGGFCAYLYFGRNLLQPLLALGTAGQHLLDVLTALIAIWLNVLLGAVFCDVEPFQRIGSNTLYLCGSEHPVRMLMAVLVEMTGFAYVVQSSLTSFVYAALTLWFANRWMVPVEKYLITKIRSAADYFNNTTSAVQ